MIQTRHKMVAGFVLIVAGIVVAAIGWWGVSGETEVAFQLPFMASAGVGALLLFIGGATALISAQLEADAERLTQIEEAIRVMASEFERLGDEIVEPRGRRLISVRRSGP